MLFRSSHGENLEKLRMDRRLSARELDDPAIDRTLVAQRLQHGADLADVGFVEIARDVGIGETHRAGQVAAVGEIDIGQGGMRRVHAAESAVVRTGLGAFDLRIGEAEVVAKVPLFHLQVKVDIAEDDVAKRAVLSATLLHYYFAVVL